jgi:hypothetical protein
MNIHPRHTSKNYANEGIGEPSMLYKIHYEMVYFYLTYALKIGIFI